MTNLDKLIINKKTMIFIGETGSGKSEIAVNFALKLANLNNKVNFFDMDQTKPIYKSREVKEMIEIKNIKLGIPSGILDAPVIPNGVLESIENSKNYTILDIGGGINGARMIGQFSQRWEDKVVFYYVINIYRIVSDNDDILVGINNIKSSVRTDNVTIVSNNNFGKETELEDIINGHNKLRKKLKGSKYDPKFIVSLDKYKKELIKIFPNENIFGIKRYIKDKWEE